MSSQTFNIGGVATGAWVLQSAGGATLSTISIGNAAAAATLVALYDNPVSGTNLINEFSVPAGGSQSVIMGAQLQHGLTVTISKQSSFATIVLDTTPDNPALDPQI